MKTLVINSHPDYDGNHASNTIVDFIQDYLNDKSLTIKNIYNPDENVHPITKEMLDMWNNINTSKETDLLKNHQETLLNEWIEADVVIIVSPLHNFSITSKLKDYFDNVLIVNRTFKYTEAGSVGLLDNSKKVLYVQTSGSDYSKDLRYVNADIAPHYLRTLLSFMGITEMELIRAQGLDLEGANKELIIDSTKVEIKEFIDNL